MKAGRAIKRKVFEAALCGARLVEVQVIASKGLSLPSHVELPAMLHYGLDLPTPIPDLDVTDAGSRRGRG